MMQTITLGDRSFRPYISEVEIQQAIGKIADEINRDYKEKCPLLIPVLNGSFMFASDLMKQLTCQCEISFIKASSYQGTSSSGQLTSLIGLNEDINGRDIIILEDIIAIHYHGYFLLSISSSLHRFGLQPYSSSLKP